MRPRSSGGASARPGPGRGEAGDAARWAERVLCVAFIGGLVLAPRLYLTARNYPLTPVVEWLPAIPFPLDHVLLWSLVAALATAAIVRTRLGVLAALGLAAILAVGDQSRWQPWFYQYTIMLGLLAAGFDRPADTLNAWRLVIAATYAWSGIQKLNVTFMSHLFPWLVEPLIGWLPAGTQRVVHAAGVVVPVIELAIGIGLVTRRCRRYAVVLAIAMHVFILAAVGPLGHWTNTVIWPWNVAMALLVALLFGDRHAPGPRPILLPRRLGHAVAVVLFGPLPALSYLGWWDAYLSGTLYSGNIKAALATVSDPVKARLAPEVRRLVQRNTVGAQVLDLWEWSLAELNVPTYPEERIYRSVGRYLCRDADVPSDVRLVVFSTPDLRTGSRTRRFYDCASLGRAR